MKRITTILLALMTLLFTQCKKDNLDNTDSDTKKVRVSCTVSLSDGGKSDFTNLMENGSVNWSEGNEFIYVAIPGETPKIIELEGAAYGTPSTLTFEGNITAGLISAGTEYDIWYFGHSHRLSEPYYKLVGDNMIEGNIATQSGDLSDLGLYHIAKGSVMAETVGSEVVLNLEGTLQHQIAVAVLDLQDANELKGNAIIGTEYSLEYNSESGEYELNVKEDKYATIDVQSRSGNSFVVLFPNEEEDTRLKCIKGDKTYATTFYGDIKANKVYFKTGTDGTSQEPLTWTEMQAVNGYEYVDLDLPSGLKWATCNVGASSPEEYGDYFAWGETNTKTEYTNDNSLTYGLTKTQLQAQGIIDENGNLTPQYDAATANWGGSWRMPTKEQMEELVEHCEWEWTQVNGVNGAKVIGPNGSCIFLPAAGFRYAYALYDDGGIGYCWSSTPYDSDGDDIAYNLRFDDGGEGVYWVYSRSIGLTVRPVSE